MEINLTKIQDNSIPDNKKTDDESNQQVSKIDFSLIANLFKEMKSSSVIYSEIEKKGLITEANKEREKFFQNNADNFFRIVGSFQNIFRNIEVPKLIRNLDSEDKNHIESILHLFGIKDTLDLTWILKNLFNYNDQSRHSFSLHSSAIRSNNLLDQLDVKYFIDTLDFQSIIDQLKDPDFQQFLEDSGIQEELEEFKPYLKMSVEGLSTEEYNQVLARTLIMALRETVTEFSNPSYKIKQGFGIALIVASVLTASALVLLASHLPLIALISICILAAVSLSLGIYFTVRGFESADAKIKRILSNYFKGTDNIELFKHIELGNYIKILKLIIEQPQVKAFLDEIVSGSND